MSRDTVNQWDVIADNNSDVAGINIAENCPAGSINNAIRTIMAQVAVWLASTTGPLLKSGGALTGALTGLFNASTILDGSGTSRFIGYRNIPLTAKTASYTLALMDVGQGVSSTTGGWVIPTNATVAFALGDAVVVYNNSNTNQSITAPSVTLRLAGTSTTGTRTLATRGLATLIKVGTDEWIASGMGLS